MAIQEGGLVLFAAMGFIGALLFWTNRNVSRQGPLLSLIGQVVGGGWVAWSLIRTVVYFAVDSRPLRVAAPELLIILVGMPLGCAVLFGLADRSMGRNRVTPRD